MNRKTIRVILFIFLALAICFASQSCNVKDHPQKSVVPQETTTPQSQNTAPEHLAETIPHPDAESKWSDTHPRINMDHLFHGEINKRGKPVGFHSRPGGMDPVDAGLIEVQDGPNSAGVYTALIWVRDRDKKKFSSIYPDRLDWAEVIKAVLYAYKNRTSSKSLKWRGPSGLGFTIEGWLLENGDINTAYPVYKNNK